MFPPHLKWYNQHVRRRVLEQGHMSILRGVLEMDHRAEVLACLERAGAGELASEELLDHMDVLKLPAGTLLMKAGTEVSTLYFLIEGQVRIHSFSENGKESTVAYATPPQVLGDLEFLRRCYSLHDAVTETEVLLISISRQAAEKYLSENIGFYRFLCNELMGKLYDTSGNYSRNLLYPAKARLAQFLLSEFQDADFHKFSSGSIARLLGITERHMSRILAELEADGLIRRYKGRMLCIQDRAGLQEAAADSPLT